MAEPVGQAIVYDVSRPRGFFGLSEEHFSRIHRKINLAPLYRVFSQARRHHAKTVVIEELADSIELFEENEDLKKLDCWHTKHRVRKVSFFKTSFSDTAAIDSLPPESFIGFAIWKEDFGTTPSSACARVYEAVIPPPNERYLHVRGEPTWKCRVLGRVFEVKGYPFYQQNGVTNVCAHAAVRTLASCYPNGPDTTYREMNVSLGLEDPDFRIIRGLDARQIETLVRKAGALCNRTDYCQQPRRPEVPYQRCVYGSIESGFPAIIIFGKDDSAKKKKTRGKKKAAGKNEDYLHAITVFGHTFNPDMWVPRVEAARFDLGKTTGYIPSDFWLGSFLGHDDTLGSHYTIPRHYMRSMQPARNDHPSVKATEGVAHVICSQPWMTKLTSVGAEAIALGWINEIFEEHHAVIPEPWGRRLHKQQSNRQLVLRSIFIEKSDYITHITGMRGWDSDKEVMDAGAIKQIDADIKKDCFWMIEVSLQELFPTNRRKLGEVLVDPGYRNEEFSREMFSQSKIAARLPGAWISPGGSILEIPITSHSALLGCLDGISEEYPKEHPAGSLQA